MLDTKKLYEIKGDKVRLILDKYMFSGTTALIAESEDGMPYAVLSVYIDDNGLCKEHPDFIYLDTNNCPWAKKFIEENELGIFMGSYGISGFCEYPLYKLLLN